MEAKRRMPQMMMLDYERSMDIMRTFLDFDVSFVCNTAITQDMDGASRD